MPTDADYWNWELSILLAIRELEVEPSGGGWHTLIINNKSENDSMMLTKSRQYLCLLLACLSKVEMILKALGQFIAKVNAVLSYIPSTKCLIMSYFAILFPLFILCDTTDLRTSIHMKTDIQWFKNNETARHLSVHLVGGYMHIGTLAQIIPWEKMS